MIGSMRWLLKLILGAQNPEYFATELPPAERSSAMELGMNVFTVRHD